MERTGEKVCLFLFGSDFGLVGVPLLFIEPQCFFEQGEIGIAETFSCLAAMLADFLFLHGAPHPGVRILFFELFQLKQVFPQHGFPLLKRIHIFFLLMDSDPAYLYKGRAARSYVKLGVTTCQMPPNPSPVV